MWYQSLIREVNMLEYVSKSQFSYSVLTYELLTVLLFCSLHLLRTIGRELSKKSVSTRLDYSNAFILFNWITVVVNSSNFEEELIANPTTDKLTNWGFVHQIFESTFSWKMLEIRWTDRNWMTTLDWQTPATTSLINLLNFLNQILKSKLIFPRYFRPEAIDLLTRVRGT